MQSNSPSPCPLPPGERVFRPPPSTGGGGGRVITACNHEVVLPILMPIRVWGDGVTPVDRTKTRQRVSHLASHEVLAFPGGFSSRRSFSLSVSLKNNWGIGRVAGPRLHVPLNIELTPMTRAFEKPTGGIPLLAATQVGTAVV